MILIIHGDDIVSSRNLYFEEKEKTKNPIFINGESLIFDQIFQAAENKSFFDTKQSIFIENFFSKNKTNTNEFKQIASYIDGKKDLDIIFWENSEVSKTALSQFKNAIFKDFSFPKTLFPFLDNIKPNNTQFLINLFHELKKTMEPELILFMIIRQLRILIAVSGKSSNSIDEVKKLAPWQISKFKRQLDSFSTDLLIKTYAKLFTLDLEQKTGSSSANLSQAIDFFLAEI